MNFITGWRLRHTLPPKQKICSCVVHSSWVKAVKMLQCPNLLRKFGKATVSAVTCLAHNCFKVLLLLLLCITLPVVSVVLVLMVLKCKDYACYLWIKNLPVFITTAPVYLITILLLILYSRRVQNTRLGKWYLDKTSAVTQLAFGSFFKKTRNPNNEEENEEEKMFTVFGHEASLKEMRWLFIILVQATLLAFAEFWDEFLLEESYSCSTHPGVHCFSTTSPLYGQPTNCSDIDTSDTEIVCYKYVFNIGHAAASAIGIMSATGLIIYIVCLLFLKLLNGMRSHKCLITCIKLLAAAETLMFWQVLDILQIDGGSFAGGILATVRSIYKTLAMSFMIVTSILSFPWNKFREIEYEEL